MQMIDLSYQVILYLALVSAVYIFTNHFLHKLQNYPPSPLLNLPIIGHLYLLNKPPLHRILAKISDTHGPVLLLSFGAFQVLVVSSPSAAEECLNKNDIIFANRPRMLVGKHLGYNYTSMVWASYGDHWRNLRKISTVEILSTHRLHMLHGIRVDEAKAMLYRICKASQAQNVVHMKAMLFEMTLNVMMRMIAGKRYFADKLEDAEEANRFREIVEETFKIGGATYMEDFVPILKKIGCGRSVNRLMRLQEKRDAFIQELINECRGKMESGNGGSDSKKKSMIEVMLTLQENEPEYYTDEKIKSLMLVLLGAGTETSTATMEWALSLLLNNPKILKKAQKEIDDQIGSERLMDESDITNLPYLRCIINETMRMQPPGPVLMPHESSEECKIGGYNIPRGTMLLVNVWAIHHDPKIWEEPRKFKPERFEGLEGSRDGYKFMPFGSGRRSCPGEVLANRVVGLTLASLLQCFDWERVGNEMVDMSEGSGPTKDQPLVAKCRPRPIVEKILRQV